MRLHIGSGPVAIPGWTNVDIHAWPGVDVVLDVRQPWPFSEVELIFAEHFLEHLTLADGIAFLRSCRSVLREDGVLRLSTPNLDWVWLTHYKQPDVMTAEEQLFGCLEMNRAFHGWGHKFLYNRHTLALALTTAGFATVVTCQYGESTRPDLQGLERHERHRDLPEAPSVLVVEAHGIASADDVFDRTIVPYVRDFEAS